MADHWDQYRKLLAVWQRNPTKKVMRSDFSIVNEAPPFPGYFRLKNAEGKLEDISIWYDEDDELFIIWGGEPARQEKVWPHCVWTPISYDWYEARFDARKEGRPVPPWPDEDVVKNWRDDEDTPPPIGHNAPPEPVDEHEALRREIEQTSDVAEYANIADDNACSRAQQRRSKLLELHREADKRRVIEKAPHETAGKAVDAKWMPMVKAAKAAADRVAAAMNAWETAKARKAHEEQEAREAERRKIEAAAKKKGVAPPPPEPEPERTAPTTVIKGAGGRAAHVKAKEVAVAITDYSVVAAYFNDATSQAFFLRRAQQVLDATGEVAPGIKTETQRRVA